MIRHFGGLSEVKTGLFLNFTNYISLQALFVLFLCYSDFPNPKSDILGAADRKIWERFFLCKNNDSILMIYGKNGIDILNLIFSYILRSFISWSYSHTKGSHHTIAETCFNDVLLRPPHVDITSIWWLSKLPVDSALHQLPVPFPVPLLTDSTSLFISF